MTGVVELTGWPAGALGAEEQMFLDVVIDLARRHVAPAAPRIDAEASIADGVAALLIEQALDRLSAPESAGGADATRALEVLVLEVLAYESAAVACWLAHRQAAVAALVAAGRSPDDVPSIADAERAASTAVSGGLAGELSQVIRTGDALLVVAGTGDAAEAHLVPAGAWTAGAVRHRTGLRGLETVTGHLDGSGERLGGGELAARARADRLLGLAASAVGIGRRAVDECATYLDQRRQFGRPLARFGALRAILAESGDAVAAAAALVFRAADGEPGTSAAERARQAARVASRAAVLAADNAVQLHGGYGYIDEYVPERLLRDAISVRALVGHRPWT